MNSLLCYTLLALFLTLQVVYADVCRKYICSDFVSVNASGTSCLNESTSASSSYTVNVYPDMCTTSVSSVNGYCVYGTKNSAVVNRSIIVGTCSAYSTSQPAFTWKPRYPGEWCDSLGIMFQCISGYRTCSNNRCLGFVLGESCQADRDCDPGLYCNKGVCAFFLTAGQACASTSACGRSMRCMMTDSSGTGKCVGFFSQLDGQKVLPSGTVMTDLHHWLCATGAGYDKNATNSRYGTCGNPLMVLQPGNQCDSVATPCTTNNTVNLAGDVGNCSCAYDNVGSPLCGVERGNSEWVTATQKFATYLAATGDCHIARTYYEDCDESALFNDYMCSYMKAKYYQANQNPVNCLLQMSNSALFPELNATQKYCNN